MTNGVRHFFEFGPFRFDADKHRLMRDGQPVHLSPKASEVLLAMVQHPGELLEREALMQAVWAESFVEDANLTVAISHLRKALGQNGDAAEYIETVPRAGYRFVADVREIHEAPAPLIIEKRTLSRTVIEEEEIQSATSPTVPIAVPASRQLTGTQRYSAWREKWALGLASLTAVSVLTFGLIWALRRPPTPGSAVAPIKSIAVLPFKAINGRQDNAHQGLGLADLLITRLSHIREINVRPTSTILAFENHELDAASAGQKLQVDAVLEGTIYHAGDKVRVTARLVRVSDSSPIWSGQFEYFAAEELKLQDEIALQVVDALALNLSGSERNALSKRYTEDADAYQLYQIGRYEWNKRFHAGMLEAERLFRNAIEKDPNFALAYVGLADTLVMNSARSQEAFALVQRALERDPEMAEAHATLGFIKMFYKWEWQEAENSFKKSIELNPGYATAHHWYAELLKIQGRHEEAKAEMRRALEINPLSHTFLADLGQIYYFNREYKVAEEYCRKALEIYPDFSFAHVYLVFIYLKTGEYDRAVEELFAAENISATFAIQSAERQKRLEENVDKGRKMYREGGIKKFLEIRTEETPDGNICYANARYYTFIGEREKALACLEKAYEGRSFMSAFVKADPIFDSLRSEPRYQIILKKMGLDRF